MKRWIKRIAVLVAGLFVFALLATWLLLSSSILAKARGDMTAQLLTTKLGQNVEIKGGVRIELGSVLHVVAEGVALPSQTMSDVVLAEIGQLEFDLALRDLLKGRINLSGLLVGNAKVQLIADQDGTTSWAAKKGDADATPPSSSSKKGDGKNLAGFLAGHSIQFSNSAIIYQDARNGLDVDLIMASFELSQKSKSAPIALQGTGTMNGQDLTLTGSFPQSQPFKVTAAFSQIKVELDGTPDPAGYDVGFSTAISVEIAELSQLLKVVKLENVLSGNGHVKAVFSTSKGVSSISGLDVLVALEGGQSLKLTGDLGKLGDPTDVSIITKIQLYSDANKPPPTKSQRDLKLIGVDMQLIAEPGGVPQRRMVIETNGFVLDTHGEGPPPISFSEISRTPDGHLKIGKLVLRIGPPEAHFVVLDGVISDALQLKGINIAGTLALPIGILIAPELFQASGAMGHVAGKFNLVGNSDKLSLSGLEISSQGTELLDLNVTGSIDNVFKFNDVSLDIAADVPSGAKMLSALGLEPVKTGHVKLTTKLSSQGLKWASKASISIAQSQLNLSMDLDLSAANPTVRGQVESDLIKIDQIREVFAAALELAKLKDQEAAAEQKNRSTDTSSESKDTKKTEPLVLPKPGDTDSTTTASSGNDISDPQSSAPLRNVTLEPLGQALLLPGMDLNFKFDLRKIEGPKGTTSLKTVLVMKDNKAHFGPVKLEYDGAHFDVSGSLDLNKDTNHLKISGSTGGWNFSEILHELKFKKKASGVLDARFSIAGSHKSFNNFLKTLNGNATVSMRNGSIDSQLLNIAGLGVVPWLFTKEKGPKVTIVCLRAPLHFSNGRISTKETVVETDRVQIVVLGDVDLRRKTLDISGQPRRIGKPLSRSPWPFTAIGPLAKPKIKVKHGPRRLKRSDGATTMPKRRRLCVPDILQLK